MDHSLSLSLSTGSAVTQLKQAAAAATTASGAADASFTHDQQQRSDDGGSMALLQQSLRSGDGGSDGSAQQQDGDSLKRLTAALTAVLSTGMSSDYVEGLKPVLHNGKLAISTYIQLAGDPQPLFIGMFGSLPSAVEAQKTAQELVGNLPPHVARALISQQLAVTDPGAAAAAAAAAAAGGASGGQLSGCDVRAPERLPSNTTSDTTAVVSSRPSSSAAAAAAGSGMMMMERGGDTPETPLQQLQRRGRADSQALAAAVAAGFMNERASPAAPNPHAVLAGHNAPASAQITDDLLQMLLSKSLAVPTSSTGRQTPQQPQPLAGLGGEQGSSWQLQEQHDLLAALLDDAPTMQAAAAAAGAAGSTGLPPQQQLAAPFGGSGAAVGGGELGGSSSFLPLMAGGSASMGGPPSPLAALLATRSLPRSSPGPSELQAWAASMAAYGNSQAAAGTKAFSAAMLAGSQSQQQQLSLLGLPSGCYPDAYLLGGGGLGGSSNPFAADGFNLPGLTLDGPLALQQQQQQQQRDSAAASGRGGNSSMGAAAPLPAAAAAAAAAGRDSAAAAAAAAAPVVGAKRRRVPAVAGGGAGAAAAAAADPRLSCIKSVQYRVSRFPSELHDLCIEHWERARCARVVCNKLEGVLSEQSGRCVVSYSQGSSEVVKGVADFLRHAGEQRIKKWRRHVRMLDFPRPNNRSGELMTAEEFLCIVGFEPQCGGKKAKHSDD